MQIGLSLSGGGFRASVFHLGVLTRLAAQGLLEQVTFISTVSGGSLCAGLVFSANAYEWPSSQQYLTAVLPVARRCLTETDLQASLIRETLARMGFLRSRAPDLAGLLQKLWGIDASLRRLPVLPRWLINATCYETGKDWRFERKRMGDYEFGYELEPDFPIAEAIAASSGYPGLIGPLTLRTHNRNWVRYSETAVAKATPLPIEPLFETIHLWDGGVYDNLGVEALFKPSVGCRDGVDFLVISDASSPLSIQPYCGFWPAPQAYRLVSIAMDQVRSLRARSLIATFGQSGSQDGCYLQLGNDGPTIFRQAGRAAEQARYADRFLPGDETARLARMNTHIRRMARSDFDGLLRHGFEVANATLFAYIPEKFDFLNMPNS